MELTCTSVVVVLHRNGMKCLFEVPDGVILHKGETVICDTRHGKTEAVCVTNSLVCGQCELEAFAEITGANFPLKKIIGRYIIESFE